MGLFSKKRVVGSMRLDFLTKNEVIVTDQIPESSEDIPYPLWFAFMYAGKLLVNFQPPAGQQVVSKALTVLNSHITTNDTLAYNDSLLGVCCQLPLNIVTGSHTGHWVYSGELFYKGNNLLVETKIAYGDEDHFHRAAIDTVFEVVRRRLKNKGGAVASGALEYFVLLDQNGCSNLLQNLQFAASISMKTAFSIGLLK